MMIKKVYDISSLDKLSSVALELLRLSDNRIFALYGAMGVGKTTLVNYLCNHLKVIDAISSPTFSIVNQYMNYEKEKIFHFDLYRIQNIKQLEKMGIDTYLNSNNYCFIEWPEFLESFLLDNCTIIKIKKNTHNRELSLLE